MAAPKRNRSFKDDPAFERTRELIRTPQLIKRLMKYTLGESDENGEVKLSTGQIRATEILLSKTLPSLQSTTIEATVSATVTLESQSEDELNARITELEGMKSPKSS